LRLGLALGFICNEAVRFSSDFSIEVFSLLTTLKSLRREK